MIKNIVIKNGRFLLDFTNFLFLLALTILSILFILSLFFDPFYNNPPNENIFFDILGALLLILIAFVFWVIGNFIIYLFVDIADNLRIIANNTNIQKEIFLNQTERKKDKSFLDKEIY